MGDKTADGLVFLLAGTTGKPFFGYFLSLFLPA